MRGLEACGQPADFGGGLEHRDAMACTNEVISGSQPGGACPDDGHTQPFAHGR